ncbi:glycoside hydrolase family 19 protein [Hoeflea sp. TYP-13]|uniref:glycoside hydrolase family 19 protein n=1 Tax=Hoeflea sp. TYP-13 TaxID=3230023 RepID=UPI0034C6937E
MNRKTFYAALRRRSSGVFGTSISQRQVRGVDGILDAFATHGDGRAKTLAYALATAYHETARRMVPVRETLARDDATARRRLRKAKYAQPEPPYGHCYYGRGQVQLTWKRNYERSSEDAGVDLVRHPDKALDPIIGARILIRGLLDGRWNGKGRGIAHYLPTSGRDDLRNARRTVNITDKWDLIAGYYRAFLRAIEEAGGVPKPRFEPVPVSWSKPKPEGAQCSQTGSVTKQPERTNPVSPTSGGGVWVALSRFIASIFGGKL